MLNKITNVELTGDFLESILEQEKANNLPHIPAKLKKFSYFVLAYYQKFPKELTKAYLSISQAWKNEKKNLYLIKKQISGLTVIDQKEIDKFKEGHKSFLEELKKLNIDFEEVNHYLKTIFKDDSKKDFFDYYRYPSTNPRATEKSFDLWLTYLAQVNLINKFLSKKYNLNKNSFLTLTEKTYLNLENIASLKILSKELSFVYEDGLKLCSQHLKLSNNQAFIKELKTDKKLTNNRNYKLLLFLEDALYERALNHKSHSLNYEMEIIEQKYNDLFHEMRRHHLHTKELTHLFSIYKKIKFINKYPVTKESLNKSMEQKVYAHDLAKKLKTIKSQQIDHWNKPKYKN